MSDHLHPEGDKIAKIIASHGLCSRREAELWIDAGRVTYLGTPLLDCAQRIKDVESIRVDGKPLPTKPKLSLWLYYKPKGVITSHKDPQGRPTLFDQVRHLGDHVISVGRLDYNSEGLIVLTNQGPMARLLELPATGIKRTYRVRVFGVLSPDDIAAIKDGVLIDGVQYQGADVVVEREEKSYQWLRMTLIEGKNREIRRLIEHFGGQVTRLIRTHYGPFSLGTLEPDQCVAVDPAFVERLCRELHADELL